MKTVKITPALCTLVCTAMLWGCGEAVPAPVEATLQTGAYIDVATDALKRAYDEYQPHKHLQYEFMENHEKLAEGVYRTTYSDGTKITVDYNKETYTVEK